MATIHVFGRLTGDPEVKQGQSGAITHFSLADNHGKDRDGKDIVDFFRCSAFGKQGEMIAASCRKGHRLNVAGRFETRTFTNNQGAQQTSLEVSVSAFDFVEPRNQAAPATAPAQQPAPQQQVGQPQVQYDKAGNGWSLINNQWVMTHPARPAAPPQQQYAAPTQPAFPPFQGQGTCPPSERPF